MSTTCYNFFDYEKGKKQDGPICFFNISQMLGHSDTRMLFDAYAPYVANASGINAVHFLR